MGMHKVLYFDSISKIYTLFLVTLYETYRFLNTSMIIDILTKFENTMILHSESFSIKDWLRTSS